MKQICGIWLPDNDTHFEYHLVGNPEYQGAGTYQWAKIKHALDGMPRDRFSLAVDIGAHVGLWSRVLATRFRSVLALEPVPELAECFAANVTATNVELIKTAAGREPGVIRMGVDDPANSGNWRIRPDGECEAAILPLDSLELESVDLIKIDVEGFEFDVITGAEQIIKRCKPFMVVEQKPGHAEKYGYRRTAAVDLLNDWGMKIRWIKSGDYFMGW